VPSRSKHGSHLAPPLSSSAESRNGEWPNLSDPLKITVDVNDAHLVIKRRFRDQQIRNRCAMPHSVMLCQVALQLERAFENIGRRRDDPEVFVQFRFKLVIVASRTG
jgi:hypothetical protein